jgi:transcription elongation factor Elf1
MTLDTYSPPSFSAKTFNCPHCGELSEHAWDEIHHNEQDYTSKALDSKRVSTLSDPDYSDQNHVISISRCQNCNLYSLWRYSSLIYPTKMINES